MQLVTFDGEHYQALLLTQAKQRLDQHWDAIFNIASRTSLSAAVNL